jgi:hypothetical protein
MTKNEPISLAAYGHRILALSHTGTSQKLKKQQKSIAEHKKVFFHSHPHSTIHHLVQYLINMIFLEKCSVALRAPKIALITRYGALHGESECKSEKITKYCSGYIVLHPSQPISYDL